MEINVLLHESYLLFVYLTEIVIYTATHVCMKPNTHTHTHKPYIYTTNHRPDNTYTQRDRHQTMHENKYTKPHTRSHVYTHTHTHTHTGLLTFRYRQRLDDVNKPMRYLCSPVLSRHTCHSKHPSRTASVQIGLLLSDLHPQYSPSCRPDDGQTLLFSSPGSRQHNIWFELDCGQLFFPSCNMVTNSLNRGIISASVWCQKLWLKWNHCHLVGI